MKLLQPKQKNKNPRPSSCISLHNSLQKPRSLRGMLTQRERNQTDLFKGVYKGQYLSQQNQSNLISYKGLTIQIKDIGKLKANYKQKSNKTVEELLQQNMQLKNQINRLKSQISRVKIDMQNKTKMKQIGQVADKLQINYQKDLFWTQNQKSHRIIGMRHQYQKLKKQHSIQHKQLESLKRQLASTGLTQIQIYNQEILSQNKRLASIINQCNKESKTKIGSPDRKNLKKFSGHSSNKQDELKNIYYQDLQICKKRIKEKDCKISYLEKLLINKDNRQYSANKKMRKIEKDNQHLAISHSQLCQQILTLKKNLQIQAIKFKSYFKQQVNKIKRQNKKQQSEKQKKIKQLQKVLQIYDQNNTKNNKLNNSSFLARSLGFGIRSARRISHDFGNANLLIVEEEENCGARRFRSQQNQKDSDRFSLENSEILVKLDVRQPKRANCKHSINSEKKRKVDFNQIQKIGEMLRFRMIGHRVAPTQIKQYFMHKTVFTQESNRSLSKEQEQMFQGINHIQEEDDQNKWEDQYITMKQTVDVLKRAPFSLTNEQSHLLSRYLIEDCEDQFVYCDMENQNKREIVKSIIKTIIGEYSLISEQEILQFHQKISHFQSNLKSTLRTYYPVGFASKTNLLQIVKGIGIQLNQKQRQYLIGKASLTSANLNELNYNQIFSQ